jgi:hypothetical protein
VGQDAARFDLHREDFKDLVELNDGLRIDVGIPGA